MVQIFHAKSAVFTMFNTFIFINQAILAQRRPSAGVFFQIIPHIIKNYSMVLYSSNCVRNQSSQNDASPSKLPKNVHMRGYIKKITNQHRCYQRNHTKHKRPMRPYDNNSFVIHKHSKTVSYFLKTRMFYKNFCMGFFHL